jgi:hypothetical protein
MMRATVLAAQAAVRWTRLQELAEVDCEIGVPRPLQGLAPLRGGLACGKPDVGEARYRRGGHAGVCRFPGKPTTLVGIGPPAGGVETLHGRHSVGELGPVRLPGVADRNGGRAV